MVFLAQRLFPTASSRSTRCMLPAVALAYPGCSFSAPTGLMKLTGLRLQDLSDDLARSRNSASSRRWAARAAVPGASEA
jgi:hypothetical protein